MMTLKQCLGHACEPSLTKSILKKLSEVLGICPSSDHAAFWGNPGEGLGFAAELATFWLLCETSLCALEAAGPLSRLLEG